MADPHDSTDIDALVRVIASLQERIRRDGDTIGSNEIRTRTALVDPLLTALGWDTTNPAMVIPEYAAGGGTADYALLKVTPDDGTPVIAFIEAKRLHEPLEPHRAQMLTYANMTGVKYAGLTNGDRWELYEVFKESPLHERRIMDVSVRNEPAFECVGRLLPLKWPILETGTPLSAVDIKRLLGQALEARTPFSVISLLLNRGAGHAEWKNERSTPLHLAAGWVTDSAMVELLLNRSLSLTAQDARGCTPLHIAAEWNAQPEVIKLLLDRGADIAAVDNGGMTPLHSASRTNTAIAVAMLLDRGANIEALSHARMTPLAFAAANNSDPKAIKLLLDRGASVAAVDELDMTPLHWATTFKLDIEAIELLLDSGADINARDSHHQTPLHYAAKLAIHQSNSQYNTQYELALTRIIWLTLETWRRPLCLDTQQSDGLCNSKTARRWRGDTPTAARAVIAILKPKETQMYTPPDPLLDPDFWLTATRVDVAIEVARGIDPNVTEADARIPDTTTPLHLAACRARPQAIAELLDHRANMEARDDLGRTPIHMAASFNPDVGAVALLIERGADIWARDQDGATVLHAAAGYNQRAVVELLLDEDMPTDVTDDFGNTPLHKAAWNPGPETAALLIARKASKTVLSKHGYTPYQIGQYAIGRRMLGMERDGSTPEQIAEQRAANEELLRLLHP